MREMSVYRWNGSELTLIDAAVPDIPHDSTRLLAADSWRVTDGAVRSLLLHYRRFQSAANAQVSTRAVPLWDFLTAVTRRLPRTGSWFPRIELLEVPENAAVPSPYVLQLRLREAPPVVNAVRLLTFDGADPRSQPTLKGPDLPALMQIRRGALMRGGDEAVLLAPDGTLREGALSAIAWWDRETLCLPPLDEAIYPSITRELLTVIADATGVEVDYRHRSPQELAGCEVWSVGSLHGIRVATAWHGVDGATIPVVVTARHRMWQRRLDQMLLPLPS